MLSVLFDREPSVGDVFIMMSKDRRKVRLFNYDTRSCSLHEKKFRRGYEFMKVLYIAERVVRPLTIERKNSLAFGGIGYRNIRYLPHHY